MFFLVVLVIALGWAGWIWSWGRDRYTANTAMMPNPYAPAPPAPLASPTSARMARRRRREVLGTLALVVLFTLLLARAWSPMWLLQGLSDLAFIAYGWAVLALERPDGVARAAADSAWPRLQPVLAEVPGITQPGPRVERSNEAKDRVAADRA